MHNTCLTFIYSITAFDNMNIKQRVGDTDGETKTFSSVSVLQVASYMGYRLDLITT